MRAATLTDKVHREFATSSAVPDRPFSRGAPLPGSIGRSVLPLTLILCLLLLNPAILCGQIERAADAPEPLSPEASQQQFQLPDGFHIELVASEPLLADPSAILVDHRGRMFVSELHGYNLEGHLDIVELNREGKLDREVRRVRVAGELLERAKQGRTGAIKRLIDRDGDGRMDDREIWADDLPPCYGMVAYRDGIIVVCGPDIVFVADRDEDGHAEFRQLLFSGFDVEVMERAINNPRWGLDGWVYVATGGGNPTATGPRLKDPVTLGRTDFRFRPDGSAIEAVTGSNGTFGHAFNDFGDRFLMTTSTPSMYAIPIPRRYLLRNPYVASPAETAGAAGYKRIYPTSKPHPWRAARGADPNWVKFYGSGEATPNGFFTSGCSPLVYRDATWGPAYEGAYFCCDPSNNLVHRALLERDGSGYRVRRAPGEEEVEFLTSSDRWCRPINLQLGPDGAIYIIDLYREIIEDYSAIPRYLQQQYGLIAGANHGRIWRVVRDSTEHRWPDLGNATPDALTPLLGDSNAWWRETAQRLLVETNDPAAVEAIARLYRTAKSGAGRLHALYTLSQLDALDQEILLPALADPLAGVRRHALRLAEPSLGTNRRVLNAVLAMTDDDDSQVRLQLALSLGESRDPRALVALADLAERYGREQWIAEAILSSVSDRSQLLAAELLTRADFAGSHPMLSRLASSVGARRDSAEINQFLTMVVGVGGDDGDQRQLLLLEALAGGLADGRQKSVEFIAGRAALQQLLQLKNVAGMRSAFAIANKLGVDDSRLLREVVKNASATAADEDQPLDSRIVAVQLLANAPWSERHPLVNLLNPQAAPKLQIAVVESLAVGDQPGSAGLLLSRWEGLSPKAQEAITDAMFARPDRLPALLEAMEDQIVLPSSISALRRTQLLESSDAAFRHRAVDILQTSSSDELAAVVQRYQEALTLPRDPQHGTIVFKEQCAKCHRLGDQGFAVGPDLSGAASRSDATLLVDLLDPSQRIKPDYLVHTAVTVDGKAFAGVLAEESATSVTLRRDEGKQDTILRKDLLELKASSKSLMPDGLEKLITPQDAADLIGYLRQALGPPQPTGVVLFDERKDLVDKFTQGGGTATIWSQDQFRGEVCLQITPSQRAAARIPGWDYRIVENPQPGEYRYLRLAWKAPDAQGALIELAASGSWPPAESPTRRYYSGKNTTPWQAQQVSTAAPADWSVVTVDLFKDNGAFTLTGLAPTAMGGTAWFDRIELLRALDEPADPESEGSAGRAEAAP